MASLVWLERVCTCCSCPMLHTMEHECGCPVHVSPNPVARSPTTKQYENGACCCPSKTLESSSCTQQHTRGCTVHVCIASYRRLSCCSKGPRPTKSAYGSTLCQQSAAAERHAQHAAIRHNTQHMHKHQNHHRAAECAQALEDATNTPVCLPGGMNKCV